MKVAEDDGMEALTEAKNILAEEKKKRAEACSKAIETALSQFNCTLTTKVNVTEDGRIRADSVIVPLD